MKKPKLLIILFLLFAPLLYLGCSKDDEPVKHSLRVLIAPEEGGEASPASGEFDEGSQMSVAAIPADGYEFDSWSGDFTGTSNPLRFQIQEDVVVTAKFIKIDLDGDGVPNELDKCPNTPPGENVDKDGCSASQTDTDGDGISDSDDQCPDTPDGEETDENGCAESQKDDDQDGVFNDADQCADTPQGDEVDENGCSASQKDSDGDGVFDSLDQCPDTPEGESVDNNGCAESQKDADEDGVFNDIDQCPGTPIGETVDENGCSTSQVDSDEDGVTDDVDQCADTASGEEVDAFGCSQSETDGDGDGVYNDQDQCPGTAEGETVDQNGCSDSQKDSDGDGVTDDKDQCDNTPSGESVNASGCSDSQTDADGDGVTDDRDNCGDTPSGETVDENGCSESQKDSDNDGVSNDLDQCPGTPSGESVNNEGCSESQIDDDADGVPNSQDQCPGTASGETVNADGCSDTQNDADGDGVSDDRDQCADTPAGESVDANGCSDSQKDSDNDGVSDDVDVCPGSPSGETVDADGCTEGQKDKTPPVVTSFTVTEITSESFTVDWNLDEPSKGYIRFGTSSGVYIGSTGKEESFLTRHLQPVGGTNPAPLLPATTYYWQIYVEDQYGNSGFSEEQSTTTLEEEARTFVPDDKFEQLLIDQGYDDVLDDFVNTNNISSITSIELGDGPQINNSYLILDYTGIQDFASLEDLTLFGQAITGNLDLSKNLSLKKLVIRCTPVQNLDLSNNTALEILWIIGDEQGTACQIGVDFIDLSSNVNLKDLLFFRASSSKMQAIIASAKSVETITLRRIFGSLTDAQNNYTVSFTENTNLRKIIFDAGQGQDVPDYINLKNGANEKIETIEFDAFGAFGGSALTACIQADMPSYILSTLRDTNGSNDFPNVTVTDDCEYPF